MSFETIKEFTGNNSEVFYLGLSRGIPEREKEFYQLKIYAELKNGSHVEFHSAWHSQGTWGFYKTHLNGKDFQDVVNEFVVSLIGDNGTWNAWGKRGTNLKIEVRNSLPGKILYYKVF